MTQDEEAAKGDMYGYENTQAVLFESQESGGVFTVPMFTNLQFINPVECNWYIASCGEALEIKEFADEISDLRGKV